MGNPYSGNAAGGARSPAIQLTEPVDADPQDAATYNFHCMERLADYIAWLQAHAAIFDDINTFTALQTFSNAIIANGLVGDDNPGLIFGGAITTRKMWANLGASTATANVRLYLENDGSEIHTINAHFNIAGGNANKWTQDAGGQPSLKIKFNGTTGQVELYGMAAGSGAWLDAAWNLGARANPATGFFQSSGQIAGGTLWSQGKITANGLISSNAPGAGQAVAAGDAYLDTLCVAWARVLVNGGVCTLSRGANIASVTYNAVGDYIVTLQVPVANKLAPAVTLIDTQAGFLFVDPTTITASAFHVKLTTAAAPGVPVDPTNATGGFVVHVYGG